MRTRAVAMVTTVVAVTAMLSLIPAPAAVAALTANQIGVRFTTASVTEGGSVTITLDRATTTGVQSVRVRTLAPSATSNVDFVAFDQRVSFPAGVASQNVTLSTKPDTLGENTEMAEVLLSEPDNSAVVAPGQEKTQVLILDDDLDFVLSRSTATVTEGTRATNTIIRRGGLTNVEAKVHWTHVLGTADQFDVYPKTEWTTFAAGEISKTIDSSTIEDSYADEDTFSFELTSVESASPAAKLGTPKATAYKIIEDDPGVVFDTARSTVVEGGVASVPVRRVGLGTTTPSVNFRVESDTAQVNSDLPDTRGTISVPAGAASVISIPTTDDDLAESTELFAVRLISNGGGQVAEGAHLVSISDNDLLLGFDQASQTVLEGDTATTVVRRRGDTTKQVTVNWAVTVDPATRWPVTTPASGTLTFQSGVTEIPIRVPTIENTTGNRTGLVYVTLSGPTDGVLLAPHAQHQVFIAEDDANIAITSHSSFTEGGLATVTLTRFGPTTAAASVTWATANRTAIAGRDYPEQNMRVDFAAGETSKSFTFPLTQDTLPEPTETYSVTVSNFVGAIAGDTTSLTHSITDNDPGFYIKTAPLRIREGASATITVERVNNVNGGAASVRLEFASGTARIGDDFTFTPVTLNYASGERTKTVTVPTIDDATPEALERFMLRLESPSSGQALGSPDFATVRILDNDLGVKVRTDFSETVEGRTVSLTFDRVGGAMREFTVNLVAAEGSLDPMVGGDFGPETYSIPVSFTTSQLSKTIVLQIAEDALPEPDEWMLFELEEPADSSFKIVGSPDTTIVVTDNDPV